MSAALEPSTDLGVDSPESLAWQTARSDAAAAHLGTLPDRAGWAGCVAANLTDTRLAPVVGRGGRWFETVVLRPQDEQPVAVVRDGPTGEPRVLVDPNVLTAERGAPTTMVLTQPSPNGRTLAALVMEAGREQLDLLLVDAATGERLPDEAPWNTSGIAWTADSTGLWCATRALVDGVVENPVHLLVLGDPPGEAVRAPKGISDGRFVVSPNGRHVALATGNTEARLDWLIRDGELVPLLKDLPGGFAGAFHGDDLVVLTDHDAPRGRLVRIPVATAADPSTWTELVAPSQDVLRFVAVVGDVLVLGSLREAAARLRLLGADGALLEEVELPGDGTASAFPYGASHPALPMALVGDDELSFIHSTFGRSWATYRYVVSERRLEVLHPPAVVADDLVVSVLTATSSDGQLVPAHVVHRADVDPAVPQPTLLHGYGGFNLAQLPSFVAEHAAWVQAGGVFVLAHLRGGSEYGSTWWSQGRREVKQQTFDDLYAVAEELLRSGRTTADRLAFKGESNGGLLAGAAVVQRPDLWAGVVADVPVLDLLGMARDPLTHLIGREEYGDPLVPEEAVWLRELSPVHQVRPAAYPPVLVTAGANDPRCPTWHARVFVDLLERAQTGEAPVLLRVYSDQGHAASGLSEVSGKTGDWLAFLADATGLVL